MGIHQQLAVVVDLGTERSGEVRLRLGAKHRIERVEILNSIGLFTSQSSTFGPVTASKLRRWPSGQRPAVMKKTPCAMGAIRFVFVMFVVHACSVPMSAVQWQRAPQGSDGHAHDGDHVKRALPFRERNA